MDDDKSEHLNNSQIPLQQINGDGDLPVETSGKARSTGSFLSKTRLVALGVVIVTLLIIIIVLAVLLSQTQAKQTRQTKHIDECSDSNHICDVNAKCTNKNGSHKCSCKEGYIGDGRFCSDIDECNSGSHVCDVNANCTNNNGSHNCTCKEGYTGDGQSCSDIDECSSGSHVCDMNANCTNTNGSHNCSCKKGYTGNGQVCSDIDECASGVYTCHSLASCVNTVGSYNCSCNNPYTGDGKACNLASECQNYNSLTSADRKITYGRGTYCDSGLSGWYRFQGSAGTRMATSCPPTYRCNTEAPGWLNGGNPTVADGQVSRQACFHWFHWNSNCCIWSQYIKVRNCGAFYVYYLNSTPHGYCHLRYCGTD